jgi:hypothetical protein
MATVAIPQPQTFLPLSPVSPTSASSTARHDRKAVLNFWVDNGEPVAPLYLTSTTVTLKRDLLPVEVAVTDITGSEDKYSLDNNAFQYHRRPSKSGPDVFEDPERIKKEYYPECESIIKSLTGAKDVVVFDYRVRTSKGEGYTGPVARVHVDHSARGAESFLHHYLPEDAAAILYSGRRWMLLNLWRPIKTVERDPLAVGDSATFDLDKHFSKAAVNYEWGQGESMAIIHNPSQRWFYKHRMTPQELWLIKHYDSNGHLRGQRCPHSAIVDEGSDMPSRHSSEIRAFAFF